MVYDLFEISKIQPRHNGSFVGICPGWAIVFIYVVKQERKHLRSAHLIEGEISMIFVIPSTVQPCLAEGPVFPKIVHFECHQWFLSDDAAAVPTADAAKLEEST